MAKQILLLFLSDVKVDRGDKHKISEVIYDGAGPAKTTNESAVRFLLAGSHGKTVKLDRIFMFASKKVQDYIYTDNTKAEKYVDRDGKVWTHLGFFQKRLEDVIPNIHEISEMIPFDEDIPVSESIGMIVKAAKKIQQYTQILPEDEEVILHADCTGGMRYASMMMLDVMRLMQYERVRIGRVFYSDFAKRRVEEMDHIYQVFDMISGAEEFVRFGSVDAIWDYFHLEGRPLSKGLCRLLEAMRQFAKEIKMCRYGAFRTSVENLRQAIRMFSSGDNTEDQLMDCLMARIRKDYSEFIQPEELDDLQLIHWCLQHDYIQQALTLYTERVPEYIGRQGIISQSLAEKEKLHEAVEQDSMHREPYFYLWNVYSSRTDRASRGRKAYLKLVREAIEEIFAKTFDLTAWKEKLQALCGVENIQLNDEAACYRNLLNTAQWAKDCSLLLDLHAAGIKEILVLWEENSEGRKELENLPKGYQRFKVIRQRLRDAKVDALVKWLSDVRFSDGWSKKYPHTQQLHGLFLDGMVESVLPEEQILKIAERYSIIKYERNHSNHAKTELGQFTLDEMKTYLEEGLQEINRVANEVKVTVPHLEP